MNRSTERGRRVFLRPPQAPDAREWIALRSASRAFLRPWDPRPPAGFDPYGADGFRAYLDRSEAPDYDTSLVCSMDDGAIVGSFNLSNIVLGAFCSAYLGYWVGQPYAGQGFMKDGIVLLLRRAFRTLGLHRVEANIQPHNAPSIALVRGAGFALEGFSPRFLKIAGQWRDHERWALVREAWRPRRV